MVAGQVTAAGHGQGPTGVGAAVDIAERLTAPAHDEAVEEGLAPAEVEAAPARILDLVQAAQGQSGGGPGGIEGSCQDQEPRVLLKPLTSTWPNTPRWLKGSPAAKA